MTLNGAGESTTAFLYALYSPKYPLVKSTDTFSSSCGSADLTACQTLANAASSSLIPNTPAWITGQKNVSISTLRILLGFEAFHEFWKALKVASACLENPLGCIEGLGQMSEALLGVVLPEGWGSGTR